MEKIAYALLYFLFPPALLIPAYRVVQRRRAAREADQQAKDAWFAERTWEDSLQHFEKFQARYNQPQGCEF